MGQEPPYRHGDVLLMKNEGWTKLHPLHVIGDGAQQIVIRSAASEAEEDEADRAPPPPADVLIKPRVRSGQRKDYEKVRTSAGAVLSGTHASPEDLTRDVAKRSGLTPSLVRTYLKFLVAEEHLAVRETKDKSVELRLSEFGRERDNLHAYAAAFALDLEGQARQIGRLVGHGPTIGGHREELLRNLLQKHIPQRFHAATGFVVGIPNQHDILIYDQLEYAPLFRSGDLVVVPEAAVRAIIEVKSTLSSGELRSALGHLSTGTPQRYCGPPLFTGVFAYNGVGARALTNAIRAFHRLGGSPTPEARRKGGATEGDAAEASPHAELTPPPAEGELEGQISANEIESTGGELIDIDDSFPITDVADLVTAVCVLGKVLLVSEFTQSTTPGSDVLAGPPSEAVGGTAAAASDQSEEADPDVDPASGDRTVKFSPVVVELSTHSKRHAEAALFFQLLLQFLRHPLQDPHPDDSLGNLLNDDVKRREPGSIVDGPWEPIDPDAFQRRWQAYKRWRAGERWDETGAVFG